jgi:hypothetical protein
MKLLKKTLAVAAAVAMVGGPVAAAAAPAAQKLSVARVGAPVKSVKSKLEGGASTTIVAVGAVAAIVGGIAVASSGSGSPKSP